MKKDDSSGGTGSGGTGGNTGGSDNGETDDTGGTSGTGGDRHGDNSNNEGDKGNSNHENKEDKQGNENNGDRTDENGKGRGHERPSGVDAKDRRADKKMHERAMDYAVDRSMARAFSFREFFDGMGAQRLTTNVRVLEGKVYVLDSHNAINLLGPGEALRINRHDPHFREQMGEKHSTPADRPVGPRASTDGSRVSLPLFKVKPAEKMTMTNTARLDPADLAMAQKLGSEMQAALEQNQALQSVSKEDVPQRVEPGLDSGPEIAAGGRTRIIKEGTPVFTGILKDGTRYGTLRKPGRDVFVRKPGGEWIAATDGMVILAGDEVRTAKNGSVEVVLDGGKIGAVDVKGGSLFRINKAETDPATGDQATLLDLALGKILVKVERLKGGSKFEVKTPTALTGVRGTVFEVIVKERTELS